MRLGGLATKASPRTRCRSCSSSEILASQTEPRCSDSKYRRAPGRVFRRGGQKKKKKERPGMLRANPAGILRAPGSLCSRYLAASAAGKQPLFNLHRPNLPGRSIHQGQLPIQSAGGYLHSPLSDVQRRPGLAEPGVLPAKQRPHSSQSQGDWVVRERDTGQRRPGSGPLYTLMEPPSPKLTDTCCRPPPPFTLMSPSL